MRRTTNFVFALCLLIAFAACGAAQETIRLQIAHADGSNDSSTNHLLNLRFKELIEERSGGRFEIDVIGDAALGSENEYFAGLKMGTIQMASCTNATVSQNTKSLMVFDLPFIFADNEAAKEVCQSDWAKALWEQAAVDSDAVILGVTCSGFRQLITMDTPVRSPADMNGLKFRVIPNDIFVATMEVLGASAVPMGFAEVITGLQQGTIDGFDLPINPFGANSVSEVVKYCMLTNHFFTPYYLVIARSVFEGLSPEDQELVRECAEEACDWNFNILWEEMEGKNLAQLEGKGVNIVRDIDTVAFQKACAPIWETYRDVIGSEILDECVRLSAAATAKAKAKM